MWLLVAGARSGGQAPKPRENQGGLYHTGTAGTGSPTPDTSNRVALLVTCPCNFKEMASLLRSPPNVTVPIMMVLLQISTAVVSIFRYFSSTNSDDSNLVLVDVEKYTDYVHVRQLSRG